MDRRGPQAPPCTDGAAVVVGPSTIIEGRGVFACQDFAEGDIIERCQVIVLDPDDRKRIDDTDLYNYYFGRGASSAALAVGNGSLYNHSYGPNARYIKNESDGTIDFVALADIDGGGEIFVNYNGDPNDRSMVWFDVVENGRPRDS